MGLVLGSILLASGVVVFVLYPILKGQWAAQDRQDDELTEAEARKRVTLLALRDVEMDYETGKLDEEDYRELKRQLSREALAALEAVEAERGEAGAVAPDPELEAQIAAVREGLREGRTCERCGHLNERGSRFCASCGAQLPVTAAAGGDEAGA
ncbi:MAG: c-type cytochrome biogenesis protein CcmI [Gemmatimonadetes bacterium]|nr:MAG: c-type cytochrome biogenesis protein CcmI [Gemmatimonadota bacterium]